LTFFRRLFGPAPYPSAAGSTNAPAGPMTRRIVNAAIARLLGRSTERFRPPFEPESAWAGYASSPEQPRPRLLDAGLESELDEQGYVVARGFLSGSEVEALARLSEHKDAAVHHRPFGASLHSDDVAYRRAVDAGIRSILDAKVEELAPGYRLCFGNFLAKAPVDGSDDAGEVKLHQDLSFVNEAEFQSLSYWIPLTDTDEHNGCLRIVPGSHRYSRSLRWPGAPFAFAADEALLLRRARAVPARAGDAVIFCAKLVHWSAPNRSSERRLVAGGLTVPRVAPLIYLHQDPSTLASLDVYRVSDDFYAHHAYRSRPKGVEPIARIPARQAGLHPADRT
jgi:hypothetical protein